MDNVYTYPHNCPMEVHKVENATIVKLTKSIVVSLAKYWGL